MNTKTLPVVLRCVCLLLVFGLNCNNSVFGQRILNGQVANPANYPFVVHLTIHNKGEKEECAGTVISNHFILTAAHCLDGVECDKIEIGKSSWQRNEGGSYMGHECYIHFDYTAESYHHDIALLETQSDLLQDPEIMQYNLPLPETTYATGSPALIVGWGRTENNMFANSLLQADVRVSDWNDCNDIYKDIPSYPDDGTHPPEDISEYSFCTLGYLPRLSGTCIADSGGPVIIDGTVAGVIVGVILDKNNVCEIGTPSLHTLVSEYIPWIMTIADLERRGKYSKHEINAPVPEPLENYSSRAGMYQ